MVYKAIVVVSDPAAEGCPYPGCIKVIHPKLFGVKEGIAKLSDPVAIREAHFQSPWVRPRYAHPMDFYVPLDGELVFIECIEDGSEWIWSGVDSGKPYTDPKSKQSRDGFNKNVRSQHERVFGMRNGSYLKFSDYLDKGGFVLEVMGANGDNPDRVGPAFLMSGEQDANFIALVDGQHQRSFSINSKKGATEIAMLDGENKSGLVFTQDVVKLTAFESNYIAAKKDSMFLVDSNGNKVTTDTKGIAVVDKNGNKVTADSKGITVIDKNGNQLVLGSDGITLKTGDATIWLPNIMAVCPFTNAPHGGKGAGITKLKGG